MYVVAGPIMILSGYFQAIGDAKRAILLSVTRTYAFAIPLTIGLPYLAGERGIWFAGPVSELLMVAVAISLLAHASMATGYRWGCSVPSLRHRPQWVHDRPGSYSTPKMGGSDAALL